MEAPIQGFMKKKRKNKKSHSHAGLRAWKRILEWAGMLIGSPTTKFMAMGIGGPVLLPCYFTKGITCDSYDIRLKGGDVFQEV